MKTERHNTALRERIEALPEDSVVFRSDFPEHHSEFVGGTIAELTQAGFLVKFAQGICKSKKKPLRYCTAFS